MSLFSGDDVNYSSKPMFGKKTIDKKVTMKVAEEVYSHLKGNVNDELLGDISAGAIFALTGNYNEAYNRLVRGYSFYKTMLKNNFIEENVGLEKDLYNLFKLLKSRING